MSRRSERERATHWNHRNTSACAVAASSCCVPLKGASQNIAVIMDLYIAATEPIKDYLTRFSGLMPGDLEPATSTHALVDLKVSNASNHILAKARWLITCCWCMGASGVQTAYLQLRCLVERGYIFVGHGLSKDELLFCSFLRWMGQTSQR